MVDTVTVRIPRELYAELAKVAARNRGSIAGEAAMAIERHVAAENEAAGIRAPAKQGGRR